MKSTVASLLAAGLMTMFAAGPARADWQYTRWGMTPEQVIAASQGQAAPATLNQRKGRARLQREPQVVAAYRAGDIEFEASFFFGADGLDLVALDLPSGNEDPSVGSRIEAQLLANYGAPAIVNPIHGGGSTKTWVDAKGGNTIDFNTIRASRTYYNLFYRPARRSNTL